MNAETVAKMLEKDQVVSWLEAQDPDTKYEYGSTSSCLIARYLEAKGVPAPMVGAWTVGFRGDNYKTDWVSLPTELDRVAQDSRTYGEALEKLR